MKQETKKVNKYNEVLVDNV